MAVKRTAISSAVLLWVFVAAAPAVHAMCGVMMKDGKVMKMKDGKATEPMPTDMAMPDGTKVTTGGVVKMKDGAEKQLNNGDMVLMDGHVMKNGGKPKQMQK